MVDRYNGKICIHEDINSTRNMFKTAFLFEHLICSLLIMVF